MQSVRTVAKSLVIPSCFCRHKFDSRIAFAVKTVPYDPLDRQEQANAFATIHDSSRINSSQHDSSEVVNPNQIPFEKWISPAGRESRPGRARSCQDGTGAPSCGNENFVVSIEHRVA